MIGMKPKKPVLQRRVKALGSFLTRKIRMGNVQTAVAKPINPYEPQRKSLLLMLRRRATSKNSTLLQLVARRDWQKVLIRATLFPAEITHKSKLTWYGTDWKVLPLHLACALKAPATVIEKLLYFHTDTASLTMTKSRRLSRRRRKFLQKSAKIAEATTAKTEEALSSSSHDENMVCDDDEDDDEDDDCEEVEIEGTKSCRMEWNLDPLLEEADCLLPLHLACLYRASSPVLKLLIDANPGAAKTMAFGMLPIHMLCAGFEIPPPIEAPEDYMTLTEEWRLADGMQVLVDAYPDSMEIASENHGVTPKEYIEETMEDGMNKTACLSVLGVEVVEEEEEGIVDLEDDASDLTESDCSNDGMVPMQIMCTDSQVEEPKNRDAKMQQWRAHTPLFGLLQGQEWDDAYDLIEQSPELSRQWQYGIEIDSLDTGEPQLWKRLPLHNATRYGAPLPLIKLLLQVNPTTRPDPYTGAMPLHLGCRYFPVIETVDTLIEADPKSAKHLDNNGRLAMHYACRFYASLLVLQSLLKAYPGSVTIRDSTGNTPLDYCGENIEPTFYKTMRRLQKFLQRVEDRKLKEEEMKKHRSQATLKTEAETVLGLEISIHSDHQEDPQKDRSQPEDTESLSLDAPDNDDIQFDMDL